jgi:hypothetical protein
MPATITQRIKDAAFDLLKDHPAGLRYSELVGRILQRDASFNPNTVQGTIWDLDAKYPARVYKPSRGLFRLVEYKPDEAEDETQHPSRSEEAEKVIEASFYRPFAEYLIHELEEVTHAIPVGGNIFREKWGTPDVVGKRESRRSDIVQGDTEIVSAEIKLDTNQLVVAFGQVCAYKLFSHKVYLVVPDQSLPEDKSKLASLCEIFGIGLVFFDASSSINPDWRLRVSAARHNPDLTYTNKYMKKIEDQLFR